MVDEHIVQHGNEVQKVFAFVWRPDIAKVQVGFDFGSWDRRRAGHALRATFVEVDEGLPYPLQVGEKIGAIIKGLERPPFFFGEFLEPSGFLSLRL